MTASSERVARRETVTGLAAFVLALLAWAIALFAPLYEYFPPCPAGKCLVGRFSALFFRGGLTQFVASYPSSVRFILAFVLLAGLVALGTYLHGQWRLDAARWLIWGATLLLALVLPVAAGTMAALSTPLSAFPFQIGEDGNPLVLLLAVCIGVALLACIEARGQRAAAGDEAAAQTEGIRREGASAGSTIRQSASLARTGSSVWSGWVALVAGMAAFALAVLTWADALFAPLYEWAPCYSCLPRSGHVSLVEAAGGFGPFVQANLFLCLHILAFLLFAGLVALGVSLRGRRDTAIIGRRLVWGGSIALLLAVAAMTTLPFDVVPNYLELGVRPLSIPLLPDPSWEGVANVYFDPAVLALILGPSLVGALVVLAAIATGRSGTGTPTGTMAAPRQEPLEWGRGELAAANSGAQT